MNRTNRKRTVLLALAVCSAVTLLSFSAGAAEVRADEIYCFSGEEFADADAQQPEGVYISSLPQQTLGQLKLGDRTVRAGDVLPESELDRLCFVPACDETVCAEIGYRPIRNGSLGEAAVCRMQIRATKNAAPTAEDSTLRTYRNIAAEGLLHASDPEGDVLEYQITETPKHGDVTLQEGGKYVYTPQKNKLGDDSFCFTVTDGAGNVSAPATVRIRIEKPGDAQTFADVDTELQFLAMWMRESGLYGGTRVAEQLCFCPDQTVTRGAFLAMAMKLAGVPAEQTGLSSGFLDEQEAPAWQQPYLTGAVRRGIVKGYVTEQGVEFRPQEPITCAEAAAILGRCFRMEPARAVEAATQTQAVPVWAEQPVASLQQSGVSLAAPEDAINLGQAAVMLYVAAGAEAP